jgi:16S rRNA processing protein RimM
MMTRRIYRKKIPGSPVTGEPEYVLIGKLQRAHGVTGEIVLGLMTDFPERINAGKIIYLGGQHTPHKITGTRPFHDHMLITMEGIRNREEAAELTNLDVFVRIRDLPALDDGRFYHHQLIGLNVLREDGSLLGSIQDILVTGANDVYVVVDTAGNETLLPAVDSVVLKIDLESKSIVVRPPEWE